MNVVRPRPLVLRPSIFLAGPSLRRDGDAVTPWRQEAIALLNNHGFKDDVYAPEPFYRDHRATQYQWEREMLSRATVIMFWIPRDMEILPGFTTNIEFGQCLYTGKIVLGFPISAPKMTYLARKAVEFRIPTFHSLEDVVIESIKMCEERIHL